MFCSNIPQGIVFVHSKLIPTLPGLESIRLSPLMQAGHLHGKSFVMKRYIVLIALVIMSLTQADIMAQTYETLWKEVENAEKKDLPKSAMLSCDKILQKAQAEGNSGQTLKAFFYKASFEQQVSPDSTYKNIKLLETMADESKDETEKMFIHSLIAEQYAGYASLNSWALKRRSDVADENIKKDDLTEWSANMFYSKVMEEVHASLSDMELLKNTDSKKFVPMVDRNWASKYFNHDLLHLLGRQAIAAMSKVEVIATDKDEIASAKMSIYDEILNIYRSAGNKDAALLCGLDRLQFIYNVQKDSRAYEKGIDDLLAETEPDNELTCEIILAKANALIARKEYTSAVGLCNDAIAKFPKYKRVAALKNLKETLFARNIDFSFPQSAYPGETVKLAVRYRNISGFDINIYAVPGNLERKTGFSDKDLSKCKLLSTKHFELEQTPDLKSRKKDIEFTMPDLGCYAVSLKADGKETFSALLKVSRLSILTINSGKNIEALVVDRKSGAPVSGSKVTLYDKYNNLKGTAVESGTTNREGRVVFSKEKLKHQYSINITATKDDDTHLESRYVNIYDRSYYSTDSKATTNTHLFTDRSIYRPGQKVYVSGIIYTQTGDKTEASANVKTTITLRNSNWQEVETKECTSNEMGSFTTDFTIPESGLNGYYILQCNNARADFRVEEYKRPTFEVVTENITKTFKLGDTVIIKGTAKSFAGAPLAGATGKFKVKVSKWQWWRAVNSKVLKNGTITIDADGKFKIPVLLDADAYKINLNRFNYAGLNEAEEESSSKNIENEYFTFTITLDVTNSAGETQSCDATVAAGNKPMVLSYVGETLIDKDKEFEFTINSHNLLNNPVECKVGYIIRSLQNPEKKDAVLKGDAISNRKNRIDISRLKSGKYEILYSAKADDGTLCENKNTVTVFSVKDTKPVDGNILWAYKDGDKVYFGTSEKDATIFVDKFTDKGRESKNIAISDSIMSFEFPYLEEYGDGAEVNFCIVRNGNMMQRHFQVSRPQPDKQLKLKWNVFRDKLTPGQKEEWTLNITDKDGKPANAELFAFMYDASLDKIKMHNLNFGLNFSRIIRSDKWLYNIFPEAGVNYYDAAKNLPVDGLVYDNFANIKDLISGYSPYQSLYGYTAGVALYESVSVRGAKPTKAAKNMRVEFKSDAVVEESAAEDEMILRGIKEDNKFTPRSNFAETAFFYPQLRTDSLGNVSIAFTLPESLTRWRFRSLAHTKDMSYGMLEAVAVAQKDIMLQPNTPRFLRIGDKTNFAAQVTNLTDNQIIAKVRFELFDPATEKVFENQVKEIVIGAKGNTSVSFDYVIDDRHEVVGMRMVADCGEFSDGEQHLLAVLSDKVHLVESVALPVRGNQVKEFSLKQLFNHNSKSATNKKLTVEFSANPAWYAVQALPTLSEPENDCVINWSNALYANEIARHIAESSPKIKNTFDSWKKSGIGKESLHSNLQKNQELKNILLNESPWVLEAKDEASQKERISNLFDADKMQKTKKDAIEKLSQLQGDDGGWSWFKGMEGSPWMTSYVLLQNIRLQLLTGDTLGDEVSKMHERGLAFMHKAAQEHYEHIIEMSRKYNYKDKGVDFFTLNYLYTIALDSEVKGLSGKGTQSLVPEKFRKMYGYFLGKVDEEPKSQDIQEKAMAAVILNAAGKKNKADEYLNSIKEHLTTTEEMGSFFDFKENPWGFGQMNLNAQVAAIEAFDKVSKDSAIVDDMKIWLLKQKQTQAWKSSAMTADAVYALLQRGSDILGGDNETTLSIGGQTLSTNGNGSVTGLNYIKKEFTDDATLKSPSIKVENKGNSAAWGAVYARFDEKTSNVKNNGSKSMSITKDLYVKQMKGREGAMAYELVPLKNGAKVAVGDVVTVRMVIKVDRDMDFIQLKEQRPACMEPLSQLSGYRVSGGIGFYEEIKDASTNFFFDRLKKGTYVLEVNYRVSRSGEYEAGLATLQCAYAPEYSAHSSSMKITVE